MMNEWCMIYVMWLLTSSTLKRMCMCCLIWWRTRPERSSSHSCKTSPQSFQYARTRWRMLMQVFAKLLADTTGEGNWLIIAPKSEVFCVALRNSSRFCRLPSHCVLMLSCVFTGHGIHPLFLFFWCLIHMESLRVKSRVQMSLPHKSASSAQLVCFAPALLLDIMN